MALVLTAEELVELTGRRRSDAQARELDHMGVPHHLRSDGTVAVLRSVVERAFGAEATIPASEPELLP